MSFIVDPLRKFEIKGQVSPLLFTPFSSGVANNVSVIAAATSGSLIRVMGLIAQGSAAGFPQITFKSASGGAAVSGSLVVPNNAAGLFAFLPIVDTGYFGTLTAGHTLVCDVVTAAVACTVFYIQYVP